MIHTLSPAEIEAWAREFGTPAPQTPEEPLVLVWVPDPVTKMRHAALKKKSEVKPTDERVRL